jgi:ubiquinone biosynthesis protein COQ4
MVKNQQWKMQVYDRFLEILKAPYGDFQAIGNLANSINDIESIQETVELLSQHPTAKYAFQNRLFLEAYDLEQLQTLNENTLGYMYSNHMKSNNLKPIKLPLIDNDDMYLMFHLTETHDIWHVVTGSDTSMAGETKLQSFVAAQLQTSRFSFAMLAKNLLKTAVEDLELAQLLMDSLATGWVMGKQAQPLFGIQWNKLWDMPLTQLQLQLNILN